MLFYLAGGRGGCQGEQLKRMSSVNQRAFCMWWGRRTAIYSIAREIQRKSKKPRHGAEYPGDQALAEISITHCPHLISDCDLKAFKMFPGKQAGQGQWEERLRVEGSSQRQDKSQGLPPLPEEALIPKPSHCTKPRTHPNSSIPGRGSS